MHFFYAGSKRRPDSVLVVSRIELAAGHEMHDVQDLMDYVYRQMKMTPEQFDALVDTGAMHVGNVTVGDFEAFQTSMPAPFPGEPSTRTLTLPAGSFLVVVVLMNMDDMASSAEATWNYVVGSLHVESASGLLQSATLYGGIAFGLLLLLVILVRATSSSRKRVATAGGPAIRAVDGYPDRPDSFERTHAQPPGHARTLPSPDPQEPPAATPAAAPQTAAGAQPAPEIKGVPDVPRGGKLLPTLPASGRWQQ